MEFEVKIARKLQKIFDVPYAKIDSTITTLKLGNTNPFKVMTLIQ
jgi:hypothetical protein